MPDPDATEAFRSDKGLQVINAWMDGVTEYADWIMAMDLSTKQLRGQLVQEFAEEHLRRDAFPGGVRLHLMQVLQSVDNSSPWWGAFAGYWLLHFRAALANRENYAVRARPEPLSADLEGYIFVDKRDLPDLGADDVTLTDRATTPAARFVVKHGEGDHPLVHEVIIGDDL